MAEPLSDAEKDAIIGRYWGTDRTPIRHPETFARDAAPGAAPPDIELDPPVPQPIDIGDIDAPAPYQPNPGAPGYNPNPAAAPPAAPPRGDPVMGALGKAFSSKESLVQNPFAAPKPTQTPIDLGDIDTPPAGPPRPPAMPTGPTPEEDAALARETARLSKSAATPSGYGGGPGLAKANPDPYGIRAAQRGVLGSYDKQREATTDLGDEQADAAADIGAHRREMARRRFEDSDIALQEASATQHKLDRSLEEAQRQLDDVRSKRINPIRSMHEQQGLAVMGVIGGILGGLYQWATKSEKNPFVEQFNTIIDRQIAVDEKNLANQREAIQGKMNLLQQQRAIYHDDNLAKLAARNLYYEAFKDELEGVSQQHESPMYRDRAKLASAEVDREQGKVQMAFGQQAQALSQAAAGRELQYRKEARDFRAGVYDKVLAATGSPALAEAEADRQMAIGFGMRGMVGQRPPEDPNALNLGRTGREELAKERTKAQMEVDANLSAVRGARKDVKDITAGGSIGNAVKGAPTWIPGVEGARNDAATREKYNMGVRQAIGAAYRLRTGGMEPKNEDLIKELEAPFRIEPSDNEATARHKMELLEQHLAEASAAKGASAESSGAAAGRRNAELGAKPIKR